MVAVALTLSLAPVVGLAVPAEAAWRYSVSVSVTTTRPIIGESVYVFATVRNTAGRPAEGVRVALQRKLSGGTWSTFSYRTTNSAGKAWYPSRPGVKTAYRAVVTKTSKLAQVYSSGTWVTVLHSGSRTLTYRANQLRPLLGAGLDRVQTSGATAWREYKHGMLVRRGETTQRTWFVTGKFYTAYRDAGGVTGRLGRPVQDMRCSLLDNGCIQRFKGGTMYYSTYKPTVTIQYGSGKWTEAGAVARSQVGYIEPSWRHNKYNTWIGANNAWCGIFQSWVSAASGNSHAVPWAKTFPGLLSAVKSRGLRTSRPAPGRIAFFDWGTGTVYHSGLIVAVDGSKLTTIEGNSTYNNDFEGRRQVVLRTRSTSQVAYYANPYE
jgi:hypothetical protein